MVHRSMENGSRVADELYIKRVLIALEDFLFFSLYSFSCIASNSTTWKHILILVPRYALRVQSCNILITCTRPRPLQVPAHNGIEGNEEGDQQATKAAYKHCGSYTETQNPLHQQKTFPSGRNGSIRVDALRQSRQGHPGGRLLRAQRQYHTSRCISPSNRRVAVSSRSVGLQF